MSGGLFVRVMWKWLAAMLLLNLLNVLYIMLHWGLTLSEVAAIGGLNHHL